MSKWTEEEIIDEFILEFNIDERTEREKIDEIRDSLVIKDDTAEFSYLDNQYLVFLDESALIEYAEEHVADLLREEPEIFNEDFLMGFIEISEADASRLAADLAEGELEGIREEVEEKYADKKQELEEELEKLEEKEESAVEWEIIRRLEQEYKSIEEQLDEINEAIEKEVEGRMEKIEEEYTTELMQNPVIFLKERGFSFEEILELPYININIEEAAERAVAMDGWEHFIGDLVSKTFGGLYYIKQ